MTTTRHVAQARGTTSAAVPQWRVELDVGRHRLVADEPAGLGGSDVGPTPFGLLVCGLVACTATTLRQYAAHKNWPIEAMEVSVVYNVVDDGQAEIVRTITVSPELTDAQRARLADVAERTPVTKAIRAGTPISTTLRTVETPTAPPRS
jgi:putative redox protein